MLDSVQPQKSPKSGSTTKSKARAAASVEHTMQRSCAVVMCAKPTELTSVLAAELKVMWRLLPLLFVPVLLAKVPRRHCGGWWGPV